MFQADHVWALAVIADRINDGYLKEDQWQVTGQDTSELVKTANKTLVKKWLRDGDMTPTEADIAAGRDIRNYFKGFLFRSIAGKMNDFEREALRIAQKDEFSNRDLLDFAIVSCLPSVMLRDTARTELNRNIVESTQLAGNEGDKINGEIEVMSCYFNRDYAKYRIRAKLVDSYVDFWYNRSMEKGERINIKAKIKTQRDDKTTQLNYVKIV